MSLKSVGILLITYFTFINSQQPSKKKKVKFLAPGDLDKTKQLHKITQYIKA